MADKIVWIFGAGFSKPLGGPLLNELFSNRFVAIARGMIPATNHELRNTLTCVAGAYEILKKTLGLVEDPEDFLNLLETACDEDNPQAKQCQSILEQLKDKKSFILGINHVHGGGQDDLKQLLAAARIQIAAVCESFVPFQQEQFVPESWKPYERWAKDLLLSQDTIVSFNYDRAVEWVAGERVWTLLPDEEAQEWERVLNQSKSALLLKLHGSVTWMQNQAEKVVEYDATKVREFIRSGTDASRLVIGIPGPGKSSLSTQILKPLWNKARMAIETADAVVIVGYRMPDTDGHAMEMITNSIRKRMSTSSGPPVVHLVLGPDIETKDMTRLHSYFTNVVGEGFCKRHRAYSQGFFLTLRDRNVLTDRS